MERVHVVEFLLLEALRRGGRHCPAKTTSVEFHRHFTFSAW
ncbi:MAG: hypothetical protein WC050_01665 [Candidatus Paceibacterota bacterium]